MRSNQPMNVRHSESFVFFGTPRFAAITLDSLIHTDLIPSLVITNPDRPIGRKKVITPPPVKTLAAAHGIPVAQPESLSDYRLPTADYSFGILAAYGKIIPQQLTRSFPKDIIGIHPSLLPKYRGATPIQNAILCGDKETGVTLFLVDEKVDHGKIVASSEERIASGDTYRTLEEKLARLGAELLIRTLPDYLSGKIIPREQDHARATFTKKFLANDAFVPIEDLESAFGGNAEKAIRIDRMIRALNPEPGVWTIQNGKRMKLLESKVIGGAVMLTKIQMEGKKPQEIVF